MAILFFLECDEIPDEGVGQNEQLSGDGANVAGMTRWEVGASLAVLPAKAGIHARPQGRSVGLSWMQGALLAFVGMTLRKCGPRASSPAGVMRARMLAVQATRGPSNARLSVRPVLALRGR